MDHDTNMKHAAFAILLLTAQLPGLVSARGTIEISDSLSPSAGRKAGQPLGGLKIEKGPGTWMVDGSLVLRDGAVTAGRPEGGTAFHPLPPAVGNHCLAAEICPAGVPTCTGLALFKANPAGNFFGAAEVSVLLSRSGGYAINVKGVGVVKQGSKADYPGFKEDGFNKVELACDAVANTVGASINGTRLLKDFALKGDSAGSLFLYAGFRLNGLLTPGVPRVRNYSLTVTPAVSAGFVPLDLSQLFFEPLSAAAIRFTVESVIPSQPIPYVVSDYQGNDVLKGTAAVNSAGECVVRLKLPSGYYELRFPAGRETFGLVALEKADRADPFFCMDSGLSWLELNPQRRIALVKILARCGIAMSRERLGLGAVNPVKGRFNWECGKRSFDDMRKTYAECKVPVLELLDGMSKHHGVVLESPYPQNLPEMAAAWTRIAGRWQASWGGAEVCNEPDLKAVPADQYVLSAKAMSYALAEARSPVPLATGVFAGMPPGPFFDTCVANGMLADSNAVSFHSYDRAPDIEGMVGRYRVWLKQAGREALPLWHSECGWAWTCGPARPPRDEDLRSALEIAAKAAESRACGVARHFPVVYVYYEEGRKNFGMMGRDATALRSMAGYAMCRQNPRGTGLARRRPGSGPRGQAGPGVRRSARRRVHRHPVHRQAGLQGHSAVAHQREASMWRQRPRFAPGLRPGPDSRRHGLCLGQLRRPGRDIEDRHRGGEVVCHRTAPVGDPPACLPDCPPVYGDGNPVARFGPPIPGDPGIGPGTAGKDPRTQPRQDPR